MIKKRKINKSKREKMLDNLSDFMSENSTSATRDRLYVLKSKLSKIKYIEELEPEEIRILMFLGKWKYELLIEESNGIEGNEKSKRIMNATCWKKHYEGLECMLKKRGQLFSHPLK